MPRPALLDLDFVFLHVYRPHTIQLSFDRQEPGDRNEEPSIDRSQEPSIARNEEPGDRNEEHLNTCGAFSPVEGALTGKGVDFNLEQMRKSCQFMQ